MVAVERVTIHHEGGPQPPSNDPGGAAAGGYTFWIGVDQWTRLRSVADSYATLDWNHRSVDVCLSGNRMDVPVYANDIAMIGQAVADAYDRGEVVQTPDIVPHRWSPGSATVCPGDYTMAVWSDVMSAITIALGGQPMMSSAMNADGRAEVFRLNGTTLENKWRDLSGKWSVWSVLPGAPALVDLSAIKNDDGRLEVFGTDTGGATGHMWQQAAGKNWSTWAPL